MVYLYPLRPCLKSSQYSLKLSTVPQAGRSPLSIHMGMCTGSGWFSHKNHGNWKYILIKERLWDWTPTIARNTGNAEVWDN